MSDRRKYFVGISDRGRNAELADSEDLLFSSDRRTLKSNIISEPSHNDVHEHIFSSNPGAGNHEVLKIDHGYPYTPATMVMVSPQWTSFQPSPDFQRTPVVTILDFQTGSRESIQAYADRRFLYVILIREGTSWPNINGQSLFIKYTILDVPGME